MHTARPEGFPKCLHVDRMLVLAKEPAELGVFQPDDESLVI